MQLTPNQRTFHSEEYKQIRAEVIGLLTRIESLFRYSIIVVASVSAWLVSNSIGIAGVPAEACLKLPRVLITLGWLISPTFVVGAGLMAVVTYKRVNAMGEYLKKLEQSLGHRELGWEDHLEHQKTELEPMTEYLWYGVLAVAIVAAVVAIAVSYSTCIACKP